MLSLAALTVKSVMMSGLIRPSSAGPWLLLLETFSGLPPAVGLPAPPTSKAFLVSLVRVSVDGPRFPAEKKIV